MRSHRPADLLHAAGLPGRLHHRQPRGRGRVVRPAPRASRGPQRGRRARLGPWSHARRRGGPSPVTVLPGPPTPRSAARPVGQGPAGAPVRLPRGKRAAWRSGSASLPWSPLGRGVRRPPAVAGGGGPRAQISVWEKGLSRRLPRGPPQAGWQWGGRSPQPCPSVRSPPAMRAQPGRWWEGAGGPPFASGHLALGGCPWRTARRGRAPVERGHAGAACSVGG